MKTHFRFATLVFTTLVIVAFAASNSAQAASCQLVAAAGDGPTKDIATIMSTHGLDNIIEHKGLKGQGPVKTKCVPGTVLVECTSQQKACK